jgi:hypothetical protein
MCYYKRMDKNTAAHKLELIEREMDAFTAPLQGRLDNGAPWTDKLREDRRQLIELSSIRAELLAELGA